MSNKDLYSTYQRIKKNCYKQWLIDSKQFYQWYREQLKKQSNLCIYCCLPGDTKEYYPDWFRKGNRGRRLEVDRKNAKEKYKPSNCVLACYPCNNAKSDVFTYNEFIEIGKTIRKVKINPSA
jgi:5-methylcytosine-specific restriction endonuclease McrA